MTDSSTAQATGLTEAQAADVFASMLSKEDGGEGETGDEQSQTASDDEPDDAEQADDGADDAEQSDEDGGDAESDDQPRKITVKIDGEEIEVTEDELKAGYSRTTDYTRKTQALAEERKAIEAERASLAPEREKYQRVLSAWGQQLSTPLYDAKETEALRHSDPAEWAARMREEDERRTNLQAVMAEKAGIGEQLTKEQAEAQRRYVAEESSKLIEKLPDWTDPAKAKADQSAITEYALSLGFTADELNSVTDHRLVLVLRDAMRMRQIEAKRPAVERKVAAVKAAAPGAKVPSSKVTDLTRARQRLAKTHSVQAAASVFALMQPPD